MLGAKTGAVYLGMRRFMLPVVARTHVKQRYSTAPISGPDQVDNSQPNENEMNSEMDYSLSQADFKWVEKLFPPSRIPQPPKHESYPTPSGWIAPSEMRPDKPYFVARNRFHSLTVYEREKPRTSQRWLTIIRHVEGDIMALEKELVEHLRPHCKYDPATRVHELSQTIWVKGLHKEMIEKYLHDLGF